MKKTLIIGMVIVIAIVAIIIGGYISIHNGLVAQDEFVSENWSQIETQLQRRSDLIPNLVKTVQAYAKHEKELFENIAEARSKLGSAKNPEQLSQANDALSGRITTLLAVAERYPDLKANTNFIRLQDELSGTENRIAVSRTRYNQAVGKFNAKIRKFPESLLVPSLGLKRREYFKSPEGITTVEKAPVLNF